MRQPKSDWDKQKVQQLLETNNKAVERAVIRIYMNQTFDEKSSGDVAHNNGIGFTSSDSKFLTSIAQWILRSSNPEGRRLTSGQMATVRPLMGKYWRQLVDVINQKAKDQERIEEIYATKY